jgi:hypothetical protein
MTKEITRIEEIETIGKVARGQKELLKHMNGEKLTFRQAIIANCYDCMGYYVDGKVYCEIKNCPLSPFMPFRPKVKKTGPKNPVPVGFRKAVLPSGASEK